MPARSFPFLCAQRAIDEACDKLEGLFNPIQHGHTHADEALDSAQGLFRKALSVLSTYRPSCACDPIERSFPIKPTKERDARIASEALCRLLDGLLCADTAPPRLTRHVVEIIRSFLTKNFRENIAAELLAKEELTEAVI